ncbi:MAG: TRAP transporter small permease [Anaerovoracaceae bacterium]|nr:TRAP transporter small permease [Anaerovoracaceae bacterium]
MKEKITFIWNHLEEIILVPAFAISTILIFVQIILRTFHSSLSWSEELVRYMYVWETWIGVSYAAKRGSHLRITMLKDKLKGKAQIALETFVVVIWIVFALFVFVQGIDAINTITAFSQKSSALRIPMQYCYLAIPVGMVLMSIRLIEEAVARVKKFNKERRTA